MAGAAAMKLHGNWKSVPPRFCHAELHRRLAAAVGFASRRLWRTAELTEDDLVILDLLIEALHRMGRAYRGPAAMRADQALREAPPHVAALVQKIEPIAVRQAEHRRTAIARHEGVPGGASRAGVDAAKGMGDSSPATLPAEHSRAAGPALHISPVEHRCILPLVQGASDVESDEAFQETEQDFGRQEFAESDGKVRHGQPDELHKSAERGGQAAEGGPLVSKATELDCGDSVDMQEYDHYERVWAKQKFDLDCHGPGCGQEIVC